MDECGMYQIGRCVLRILDRVLYYVVEVRPKEEEKLL